MRHIAVTTDFVAGIDNDHTRRIRQDAGGFPQDGGLANPGPPHDQNTGSGFNQVLDDITGTINSAANPAGQAHNLIVPVADG